jgi:hypothetical protein
LNHEALLCSLCKGVLNHGHDVTPRVVVPQILDMDLRPLDTCPNMFLNATGDEKAQRKIGISPEQEEDVIDKLRDLSTILALIDPIQENKEWAKRWG